jgi:hypothetical protein
VGDLWQYEDLYTSTQTVPGFSEREIFEIRVTKVDTLEDGSRYIYVNHNYTPRWYIDSAYVYLMPSKLKLFSFSPDESHTWWASPHPDTTDIVRSYWRKIASPQSSDVLGATYQIRELSEWFSIDRGDTTNPQRMWRTEMYAHGLGLVSINKPYFEDSWRLKGAIIGVDTLGSIEEVDMPDISTWFPVQVGNRWQYRDTRTLVITEERVTRTDTLPDGSLEVYINDKLRGKVDPDRAVLYWSYLTNPTPDSEREILLNMRAGMWEPWWRNENRDDRFEDFWYHLSHYYNADIFGEFRKIRVYTSNYTQFAGDDRASILSGSSGYAEGIGRLYTGEYTDLWDYLIGAEIDGQIYGTLVSLDDETYTPDAFHLAQNYPNPFNPSTTIRYALSEAGPVRLEVFDITGRSVSVLVDQSMQAGNHTAVFDASKLSSGIYLYRLTSGNRSIIRKMIFAK